MIALGLFHRSAAAASSGLAIGEVIRGFFVRWISWFASTADFMMILCAFSGKSNVLATHGRCPLVVQSSFLFELELAKAITSARVRPGFLAHGSTVRWSASGDTARVPLGCAPDLSACAMASPMNFCTVLFMGRAPNAL